MVSFSRRVVKEITKETIDERLKLSTRILEQLAIASVTLNEAMKDLLVLRQVTLQQELPDQFDLEFNGSIRQVYSNLGNHLESYNDSFLKMYTLTQGLSDIDEKILNYSQQAFGIEL